MSGETSQPRSRRRAVGLLVVITLVAAGLGVGLSSRYLDNGGESTKNSTHVLGEVFRHSAGAAADAVTWQGPGGAPALNRSDMKITGTLSKRLAPGRERSYFVHMENTRNRRVWVQKISIVVKKPAATGCLARWVAVGHYTWSEERGAKFYITKRSMRSMPIAIKLRNLKRVNQDACKGATFPLKLSAAGQLA